MPADASMDDNLKPDGQLRSLTNVRIKSLTHVADKDIIVISDSTSENKEMENKETCHFIHDKASLSS